MRTVKASDITKTVSELCIKANLFQPEDVKNAIRKAYSDESWPVAKEIMGVICENINIAESRNMPVCQDTGLACVFVELGQEVYIQGNFEEAVQQGVREGYLNGYLRKSVVSDPLRRVNTNDNTPAFIKLSLVPGDKLKISVMPKGFGSENMSRLKMLNPSAGVEGVKNFVIESVRLAGSNPCPPVIVGVGIGGTFDHVAYLSKKALLRPLDCPNSDPFYAQLEKELLSEINALGIGPQGYGGSITALGLAIETAATHVAGLPVAVNMSCHVTRRSSAEL